MMITSGIKAQYTMGTTGMMNIPTAEMQQTGTFMIGGNYLPEELNPFKYNSGNYFVNITFFSFLELNYRCILLKSDYMAKKPKFNQQDRSLSVRLRPLKEGKHWPAIVIGDFHLSPTFIIIVCPVEVGRSSICIFHPVEFPDAIQGHKVA